MKREAEAEGLDRVFRDAGFFWGESGCSMCAGGNGDRGEPGERMRLDHQPQFRAPPGPEGAHASGQPGDGGGDRDRRPHRRRAADAGARLMQPFTSHTGIAVPLLEDDINTDQIAPVQAMRELKPDYKKMLFMRARARRREDPDFVLNKPQFRNPGILVTGNNFGAGSSREAAVWGMLANNIRVIVAKSFADIYRENCLQNGLLPVVLAPADADAFIARVVAVERRGAVHGRSADADASAGPGGPDIAFEIPAVRPHAAAGRARRHRADAQAHRRDRGVREAHGGAQPWLQEARDSRR